MAVVVLLVFRSLVHSQTFPNVSFMGQTLANHSYVNLSLVGTSGSDSVQCHSDLYTCCSRTQGPYRGDWYFPRGDRLPLYIRPGDIYEYRYGRRVDLLRRNDVTSPSAIYRCDIAAHDDTDISVRDTVYVGLYSSGGVKH